MPDPLTPERMEEIDRLIKFRHPSIRALFDLRAEVTRLKQELAEAGELEQLAKTTIIRLNRQIDKLCCHQEPPSGVY